MPRWVRSCAYAAALAALPTVVWRVLLGVGLTLGTPVSWRAAEQLPGSGTGYVLGLSVIQLVAALLTLVLITPLGRRLPRALVLVGASLGAVLLVIIVALSLINWGNVDPFRDATVITGWAWLCWACYLAAVAWPVLLVATIIGYARHRDRTG